MNNERKISSLIRLLDDPDEYVYHQISNELMDMGHDAIPPLERAWDDANDPLLQERIAEVVHQIEFRSIQEDLALWKLRSSFDLIKGVLIINRYGYSDLNEELIINKIEELKRVVWEQLEPSMTPLEQVRLLNHVFFQEFGFQGNVVNHSAPDNSYLNVVIHRKKGNQISLAILYMSIAQRLDIPIYGINLPQHFALAYTKELDSQEVLFYINPFSRGTIFNRNSIDEFLLQLDITPQPDYYVPCNNQAILNRIIRNLTNGYALLNDVDKVRELETLRQIIQSE